MVVLVDLWLWMDRNRNILFDVHLIPAECTVGVWKGHGSWLTRMEQAKKTMSMDQVVEAIDNIFSSKMTQKFLLICSKFQNSQSTQKKAMKNRDKN